MMEKTSSGLELNRRNLLLGAAGLAMISGKATAQTTTATSDRIPVYHPQTEFVFEAIVDVAPGLNLGEGPLGRRGMVPITGGTFEGPNIRGTVLAGGADRQLNRDDGFRLLDALYELQTDDGAIITIHNQVMSPPNREPGDPRFSQIKITAPEEYDWLNKSVFVGTLDSLRPERAAVVVRVFRLF